MVNLKIKLCRTEACSKYPSFGAAGARKAEFCAIHATAGMVNVKHKRCGNEGCSKRASFGAPGGRKAEFCAAHAPAGMGNVRKKRYGEEGCSKRPSFGAAGGRKARSCATHASAGMVDAKRRRCVKDGCFKYPWFGAAGGRVKGFCATDGRADMVDAKSKRCDKERCSKRSCSSVGAEAELFAIHIQTGMNHQCASQRCVDRVWKHGNARGHAELESAVSSDAAGYVQEKYHPTDGLTVGGNRFGIDGRGEGRSYSSDAGPNVNDGDRDVNVRLSSRATRARRRGGNVTPTPPAALGQRPDAAAGDWAETRMKMETKAIVEPALVPKVVESRGELNTAKLSSCGSNDSGGSRSTMKRSCGSSITIGRNTKRLRRAAQVQPVFDVATGGDVASGEDGADVKLELGVSALCGHVPASSSYP
ncbi:unnamed protein product [Sphacelaria rigidula]